MAVEAFREIDIQAARVLIKIKFKKIVDEQEGGTWIVYLHSITHAWGLREFAFSSRSESSLTATYSDTRSARPGTV
ncbi:hypothetical protein WAI453_002556 [Rhynchosporium graminicola]